MAITYHFFRHVKAPKNPKLRREADYGFRRAVSTEGIKQGQKLRRCIRRRGIKPVLVLHSESPRAIVTTHLACQGVKAPYLSLKKFWPQDAHIGLFRAMWDILCQYNFSMERYLTDEFAMSIFRGHAEMIWKEIQEKVRETGVKNGDVLIFGHGVWNNFIAWAAAGFPEDKEKFFPKLFECDELRVKGEKVTYHPFNW